MTSKVVEDADVVPHVVCATRGDEAVAALAQFARTERLEAAQVTPSVPASERSSAGSTPRLGNTTTSPSGS
jgi:hypothetical protein